MDEFKGINDRYDYLVGDQVLTEVGERLRKLPKRNSGMAGASAARNFAMLLGHSNRERSGDDCRAIIKRCF